MLAASLTGPTFTSARIVGRILNRRRRWALYLSFCGRAQLAEWFAGLITQRSQVQILSPLPCDLARDRKLPNLRKQVRVFSFARLVVAFWVDVSSREELSGDGVHDADFEVLDEQDDVGSGVGSADADVVQFAVDAQRHGAGFVDAVVTDPVVGVGVSGVAGQRFGHGVEQGCWCCSVGQGSVGSAVVVFVDELVEQCLELVDRGGLGRLGAEPLLEGLLEPFDFALGGGVVGSAVLLDDVQSAEFVASKPLRPPWRADAGEADGEDHAVVGQC